MNLSTKDTIRFQCVIIDGNVVNGSRQPILYMFVLDKLLGFKDFCEPETIHYKRINQSVLKTRMFCIEDDENKEVIFSEQTLNFCCAVSENFFLFLLKDFQNF